MKILVAMSGGVDSSVAAFLLKEQGHDVAGITMLLGYRIHDEKFSIGEHAASDAATVCDHLGIPHYTKDCINIFDDSVIADFTAEYSRGRTPNPCVICNRVLKFGSLFNEMKSLGYEKLATGHYADKGFTGQNECIKKHFDKTKDQSYFLYGIDKNVLPFITFPLAHLEKSQVRIIAGNAGIPVAQKKESQDICFISGDYRNFPRIKELSFHPGNFINSDGKILGEHTGIHHYTIGQRKGLGVSAPKPLYVIKIDLLKNEVLLGYREELISYGLIAKCLNFFTEEIPDDLSVKIRYGKNNTPCRVTVRGDSMTILFSEPLDAVTPGQSAVIYSGEMVVGGGIIDESFHYQKNMTESFY